MDVKEKILSIVSEICETTPDSVTLDSTIGDFPAWDSMGHLAILSKVEEEFDISFEPDEMMDLEDVNDIIKAVEDKL